ncbi:2-oxo acid dehydrogenase subunit E2 [Streptomyces pseudovenezuelae]
MKALNDGLRQALLDDPKVLLMGEDIGRLGGVFRVTDGLRKEFGDLKGIDTPLGEAGIVGAAIGLAMRGYRPVCEIQFDGFVYPAVNQIISQLAKLRHRSAGLLSMPVVIRIPYGGGIGSIEHHSESPETRIPIRGVRKHTAAAMVASAFTAPHVTEFITVDVSATMRLRELVAGRREFREVRVTPLVFFARALLIALATTPEANASWDEEAQEIVLKHYVNLGVAAATDRGLVVPNIKSADRMSLRELAEAFAALTATARAGRTSPQDMLGGTITLTNVGVFGVDTGTPILNPGEAAILAVGAIRRMPWVVQDDNGDERIEPRWVTQLALSFDHRLMDGKQGSELLADVAAVLHEPGLALL